MRARQDRLVYLAFFVNTKLSIKVHQKHCPTFQRRKKKYSLIKRGIRFYFMFNANTQKKVGHMSFRSACWRYAINPSSYKCFYYQKLLKMTESREVKCSQKPRKISKKIVTIWLSLPVEKFTHKTHCNYTCVLSLYILF